MDNTKKLKLGIIDWDEALRLANNNHQLAKEMLQLLTERLPDDRDDIVNAFNNQDLSRTKQLSHKLRGALCYCGVPRLRQVVERLDNELKKPASADILSALVTKLNHEVELLLDVVRSQQMP